MIGQKPPRRYLDPRFLVGIILMVACLTSLWFTLYLNNYQEDYYVVKKTLIPGEVLKTRDLKVVKINPGELKDNYIKSGELQKGQIVVRSLMKGELLSKNAISNKGLDLNKLVVQLSGDLPSGLSVGENLDIWTLSYHDKSVDIDVAASKIVDQGILVEIKEANARSQGSKIEILLTDEDLATMLDVVGEGIPLVGVTRASSPPGEQK